MHTSVTLTAEEFTKIHNALCDLSALNKKKVNPLVASIREALAGAYAQDQASFDSKGEHYETICQKFGLKTVWSMYEVSDMNNPHPYVGATKVAYKRHWGGDNSVIVTATGNTWADLYVAADACIRNSGDNHHIFIEDFEIDPTDPTTLLLSTGS